MLSRIKDLLIIVPGFHLASCLIYLFFYHAAFGNGLAYFASPNDIFSVSLADVAPAYVWLSFGLVFTHFAFRRDWKRNEFRMDGLPEEEREKLKPHASKMLRLMYAGLSILMLQAAGTSILYYMATGRVLIFFTAVALQVLVISSASLALYKLNLTKNQYDLLSNGGIVLVALAISGTGDAQADKYTKYVELPQSVSCNAIKIRKPLSEYWLGVASDESRVLVDKECNTKFRVIPSTQFRAFPDGTPAHEISKLF